MRDNWIAGLTLLSSLLVPIAVSAAPPPYESPPEQLPRVVDAQPVPFDHRLHMEHRMACLDCHPGAREKERAGLPQREQCMLCHRTIAADRPGVRQLASLPQAEKIPWERVYRVADFVFFSHRDHAAGAVGCEACHGPVETRTVLNQELSTNMVACMNCHVLREASTECFLCHDLGQ